jgi:FtsP/CotA-like multicopper oxidase with cupredoxin domain
MANIHATTNTRHVQIGKLVIATTGVFAIALVITIAHLHQSQSSAATLPPQHVQPQQYDGRIGTARATNGLSIDGTRLVSGPANITVHQGDNVYIPITAPKDEVKVHLSGYEIITEAGPDGDAPGAFSFIADTKGNFPFYSVPENGGAEVYLGTIEVQ